VGSDLTAEAAMPETLFIDTTSLPRVKTPHGEMTEILNQKLAGARNVVGTLRWLQSGETYTAEASGKHQLLYLMEGAGRIRLEGQDHPATKGMGVYLGPSESATIQAAEGAQLKLFQLVVPRIPK
jgi:glyoxylate utilization-related uncharacterized protein